MQIPLFLVFHSKLCTKEWLEYSQLGNWHIEDIVALSKSNWSYLDDSEVCGILFYICVGLTFKLEIKPRLSVMEASPPSSLSYLTLIKLHTRTLWVTHARIEDPSSLKKDTISWAETILRLIWQEHWDFWHFKHNTHACVLFQQNYISKIRIT